MNVDGTTAVSMSGLQPLKSLFAAPDTVALPDRVKAIIAAEDRASEHVIGLVQIGLGLVLWCLYLIAPKPIDADVNMLAPVPVALAIYMVFSIARYWVITRQSTASWFVVLSIVADVALVIGLIWSFQRQYGCPPGFVLKAPTFVYLFVLIVLRSLRFDPRYVLMAGLASAAGWAIITLSAVMASPAGSITRSFTDYITSNHILIGAEFDKIFAMLLVTVLLTANALRAQRTLVAAVRQQAAASEISRFLSQGVADQISGSGTLIEAGDATERDAAILMLDVRGFTPFAAKVAPQDVVGVLTSLHARVIPIIRANGGVVDKFLGDGVMATFGGTRVSTHAAADALRALEQILDQAIEWERELPTLGVSERLTINAGVASGPVVFATLGSSDRLEYTVIGAAVNLAAKLEKHNKAAATRALLPVATLRQAEQQGFRARLAFKQISDATVAGVPGTIDLCAREI